ncbi:MAG: hypothetical protein WC455_10135 [Dehalococcoidia bacterium]|jgi:hypothetical protein
MKLVKYYGDGWRFLTDEQFTQAIEAWGRGQSYCSSSTFNDLLPPPKSPAGTPPEHRGLDVYWALANYNENWTAFEAGWFAIRKPAVGEDNREYRRAAVYVRQRDNDGYRWSEVNVKRPHDLSVDEETSTDEVRNFARNMTLVDVDEAMRTEWMRDSLPWGELEPAE